MLTCIVSVKDDVVFYVSRHNKNDQVFARLKTCLNLQICRKEGRKMENLCVLFQLHPYLIRKVPVTFSKSTTFYELNVGKYEQQRI